LKRGKSKMSKHLFKLKNNGKTVGYLEIYQDGIVRLEYDRTSCPWVHTGWPYHLQGFLKEQKVTSVHPFVTKDKNNKDVFAGDKIKFLTPTMMRSTKGIVTWYEKLMGWIVLESEKDEKWSLYSVHDIELIEDTTEKEN